MAAQTGSGAYAQRFDANGEAVGASFSTVVAPQSIIVLQNNIIVICGSSAGPGGTLLVRAQMFAPNGERLGTPVTINSTANGEQAPPAMASLRDGGFVVAWTSVDVGGSGIKLQLLSSAGVKIGAELTANSTVAGDQRDASVFGLSTGGFVVAWTDSSPGISTDVRAQIYDSNGARVGLEFVVNTAREGNQAKPTVKAFADGGFIVVYEGEDGDSRGVFAQIFDGTGSKIGEEIQVNTVTAGAQVQPQVAVCADGAVVVSWQDYNGEYGPGGADIVSQLLYPSAGTEGADNFSDSAGDDELVSGGGDDRISVTAGNDRINGGSGSDTLTAHWSDLTTSVRHTNGPTVDARGGYFGLLSSGARSVDYIAIERFDLRTGSGNDLLTTGAGNDLIQSGAGADVVFGMGGNDLIVGGAGNDSLDGGTGADTTAGGSGDDVHYVDSVDDQVSELQGEGRDFVYTTSHYTLRPGTEVEVLRARDQSGTEALNLFGNEFANVLHGNNGANILRGGAGDDIILGYLGDDNIDGGAGADNLTGGLGDDTYHVDNASDLVIENVGEGRDTIFSAGSYNLREFENVELLIAADRMGVVALNFTGNSLANIIKGNAGANILGGGAGDDILLGYEGNDNLNGGTGADNLTGGLGDDTYHVDNASDVVVEYAGEGRDTIFSAGSYNLREFEHVELLVAADRFGTASLNFSGNSIANIVKGNAGANSLNGGAGDDILLGFEGADTLIGGAGADVMTGGLGDDIYYVDSASDVIVELAGEGRDRVFVTSSYIVRETESIEYISTADKLARTAINLTGNSGDNIIFGNAGRNIFDGKGGNDILVGLEDADRFLFSTALNGVTNVDTIQGFEIGYDKIWLDDAIFTGLSVGALAAGAFVVGAAAADADDRIIYNSANGSLLFDRDGAGGAAAVQFAIVDPNLIVTAYDFLIF